MKPINIAKVVAMAAPFKLYALTKYMFNITSNIKTKSPNLNAVLGLPLPVIIVVDIKNKPNKAKPNTAIVNAEPL